MCLPSEQLDSSLLVARLHCHKMKYSFAHDVHSCRGDAKPKQTLKVKGSKAIKKAAASEEAPFGIQLPGIRIDGGDLYLVQLNVLMLRMTSIRCMGRHVPDC